MEIQSVPAQVSALFADLPAFARLAAGLTIENYQPRRFPREQVSEPQEAFAALFLLDLHYQNDWIYSEAARTNADQFVIDRVPAGQWTQLLQDKWIADYFGLSHRRPQATLVEPAVFLQKLLLWMPENTSLEDQAALKAAAAPTQWVCSLFPGAFYDKYFGQTAEHYFFAESGVYD